MNEGTKTGIFWAVAVVMAGFATFVAWPTQTDDPVGVRIGKPLFEEFQDPLAAANLKIVTFDETLGQLESFEVAKDRQTGVWSIPSRQGYPADATEQMQQAATALLGLKILDVKTDKAEEHNEYGVLEPDVDKLRVGDEGVGRLVSIKDDQGTTLAALIVGDKVKGMESHRYVRIPNQDPVYEVELDDAPLTTEFRQWIEDDLLKLSSFDVTGAKIRNYTVAVGGSAGGGLAVNQKRRYDANLVVDDSNEWKLENLVVFDAQNAGKVESLEAGESLNTEKLNSFKNALDDLKIVDVVRKPEGMSADLKAEKSLVENEESLRSLASRGFYPVQGSSEGGVDILAANGELVVELKDGIEYVLRFGGISGIEDSEADASEDEEATDEPADGGANRYLLVTTRVNQSKIPAPELKVVPETLEDLEAMLNPPPEEKAEQAPADSDSADSQSKPEKPAEEPASEEPATEEPASEEPATEEPATEEPASEGPVTEEPASEEPATEESDASEAGEDAASLNNRGAETLVSLRQDEEETAGDEAESSEEAEPATEEPAAEKPASEEPASDEPATEEPAAEEPGIEAPANAPAAKAETELTEEEKQERLEAEQEKIRKENQRLVDAWKEKLKQSNSRVRELNSRFADWYYIIPESTYSDLQIQLDELITKEGEAAAPASPGADPAAGPNFPAINFGGN